MTPDTTAYMIAGLVVVFAGIIIYVISLYSRYAALKRQAELLVENDPSKHPAEPSS